MPDVLTLDAVAGALADALATVCGTRLGGDATAAPSDPPPTIGVTLAVPVSGSVAGRIAVWFERASAIACARALLKLDQAPADAAVDRLLADLVDEAAAAAAARPELAGLVFGAATAARGRAVAGATGVYLAVPNTASCRFAVGADHAPAVPTDDRLGVVLGVELPIVVRFGRTVMPLRAIAELGPGSIIDMGRSPEEPVDLLVGDRLIARGEVVVVGGNYGVRITYLASGREDAAAGPDKRLS